THDYLVPSVRDWLTRKQRETRRGRAELRLAERAALWMAKPEDRYLPGVWEWASLRLWTRKKDWTAGQRQLMLRASGRHAGNGLLLVVALALLVWVGWAVYGRMGAETWRARLLEAAPADVPGIVHAMKPYRRWINPLLEHAQSNAEASQDR